MPIDELPGRRSFVKTIAVGLASLRSTKPVAGEVVIRKNKVDNILVTSCSAPEGGRALVEVRGSGSKDVTLALNRVPKGVEETAFADGANASAVEKRA